MKKYLFLLLALIGCMTMTSCLESGWEELDTYDGTEITGLVGVYSRYIDTSATIPASGQNKVIQTQLNTENAQRDVDAGTLSFDVTVPTSYTGPAVKATELVVIVNLSTAAVVEPVEGAPKFGVPGDWTKPNKYEVTAANGDTKIWTVTATLK